ncbi:putative signaling protein [Phytophthora ramorum]|uniref:putative signaling protein n=1 Tax=Phytophthora ramorum TaxID=164328 RepID=UPI0030A31756|nr:putative signaling protein [Phytophthora ramorum]
MPTHFIFFAFLQSPEPKVMDSSGEISQHWQVSKIFLSYLIAITGSFCTIQLMEKWRSAIETRDKLILLMLSSVALGGCGIWCMHFTGMNALELTREDGSVLTVNFEAGLTILSFICAVGGVFIGLWIASADPFFLELEQEKRKNILVKDLAATAMSDVVNKQKVAKRIKFIALFSRLPRIAGGGLFAALGVLVMHYLGMMAQRADVEMTLSAGVVVVSVLIAFFTATAAFWILFRALTFFQDSEMLRLGSALIMGIAVCGTHYSGMGAASYVYTENTGMGHAGVVMKGSQAAILASHGSLLFCYWVMTWSVASSVRNIASMTSTLSKVSKRDPGATGPRKIVVGQVKMNESSIRVSEHDVKANTAGGPAAPEAPRGLTVPQESMADTGSKSSVSEFDEV